MSSSGFLLALPLLALQLMGPRDADGGDVRVGRYMPWSVELRSVTFDGLGHRR